MSTVVPVTVRSNRPKGTEWRESALCLGANAELFFPEKGETTGRAKRICENCPVRAECLTTALLKQERFGIWGGFVRKQLRLIAQMLPADATWQQTLDFVVHFLETTKTAPNKKLRTMLPNPAADTQRTKQRRTRQSDNTLRDQQIQAARNQHLEPREIAKRFGVSVNTVYRVSRQPAAV
ncbi:MAG TPA: WhiB family transcriptional regulator [Candidatus Lumbricidophila sp.]|nr:WhiB family transcriptional regulator [Candidatus Lumbricidophila sp.]